MAGIVATLPSAIAGLFEQGRTGAMSGFAIIVIVLGAVAVVGFICFVERAQRRILIQYPKRQVGNRMAQGDSSHLPLKLNTSGVIPPIFASSLLLMPLTLAQFAGQNSTNEILITITTALQHGSWLYMLLYGVGIMFFWARKRVV